MSRFDYEANAQIVEHAAKPKQKPIPALRRYKQPRDYRLAIEIVESLQRIVIGVAIVAVIAVCVASAFAMPRFDVKQLPPPQPHETGLII